MIKGSFIALLLLIFSLSVPLSAKGNISKEIEKLGKELLKETAFMFSEKQIFNPEDLVSKGEEGKDFNYKNPLINPLEKEIHEIVKRGQSIEAIDSGEAFLQESLEICSNFSQPNEGGLHYQEGDRGIVALRTETCEDHISKIYTVTKKRDVNITPEIVEKRKICKGHKKDFSAWKKNSLVEIVKEFKKSLEKKEGKISLDYEIDSSFLNLFKTYSTTAHWTHHDTNQGCNDFQEKITEIRSRVEQISWTVDDNDLLKWLEGNKNCYLYSQSFQNNLKTMIFRCESGENRKCQSIRDAGGILEDKECIDFDLEGNCLKYLKTFSFQEKKPLKQEYFLDDQELFDLKDFETVSEPDNHFSRVISWLAAAFSGRESTDVKISDPLKSPVFPGKEMRCRKSCSTNALIDCCGSDSIDFFKAGKCTQDEIKLREIRKEGKCHFVGIEDSFGGLYKEQVYVCYPDVLSRVIQEEAHKELNLPWGTPIDPDEKSLLLKQLSELNFEKMDLSDIEKDLMGKIDQEAIKKRLQTAVGSFNGEDAQRQTENLLKEDMKKCL